MVFTALALLLTVSHTVEALVELEVEWKPGYCTHFACSKDWKKNDFAIIGFRPYPYKECLCGKEFVPPEKKEISLIRYFFPHRTDANAYLDLWKDHWNRFGCCMSEVRSSTEYLLTAVSLMMDIHPLEKLLLSGVTPGKPASVHTYQSAFPQNTSLTCSQSFLSTISFYLSPALLLVPAPPSSALCPAHITLPLHSSASDL